MLTRPIEIDGATAAWNNKCPMEITLALVADAANVSREGKLNILGAFSNINTESVPAIHPEMVLVLNLEASVAEAGTTKELEVKMLTADGKPAGGLKSQLAIPDNPSPGERIRMQGIFRLNHVVFPEAGTYQIAVLINGETKKEIPLSLTLTGGQSDGD